MLCSPEDAFSVLILAGGAGKRLGQPKANLMLAGQSLLSRAVAVAKRLSEDVVVVGLTEDISPLDCVRYVPDRAPHAGVLAGLAAGLVAVRQEWAFCMGCDMPLVNPMLVRELVALRDGRQAVVPRCALGPEPLHALYRASALANVEALLSAGERRVGALLDSLHVRFVDENTWSRWDTGLSFVNINTPRDLAYAREQIAERTDAAIPK